MVSFFFGGEGGRGGVGILHKVCPMISDSDLHSKHLLVACCSDQCSTHTDQSRFLLYRWRYLDDR